MVRSREIRTENTVFKLHENGIIESVLINQDLQKYELDEVKEFVSAMKELCMDEAYPIVSILGDAHIPDEGRKYILDHIYVGMAALVGSTFIARMVGNLLINFKPLPIPVKMFSNREAAYEWIEETQAKLRAKEGLSKQA